MAEQLPKRSPGRTGAGRQRTLMSCAEAAHLRARFAATRQVFHKDSLPYTPRRRASSAAWRCVTSLTAVLRDALWHCAERQDAARTADALRPLRPPYAPGRGQFFTPTKAIECVRVHVCDIPDGMLLLLLCISLRVAVLHQAAPFPVPADHRVTYPSVTLDAAAWFKPSWTIHVLSDATVSTHTCPCLNEH